MFRLIKTNILTQLENVPAIKMEISSSSGEECLGHDETLNLLESWRETLGERQVKDENESNNNTITVSVGPQFEADISSSFNLIFKTDF